MRALMIAAPAALAVACLGALAAAPAQAQDLGPVQGYGSVGYVGAEADGINLGLVQGRLGARFGRYFGVEGELGLGVNDDTVDVLGTPVDVEVRHQEAGYVVGFIPVSPNFDVFGRVGYGNTELRASAGGVSAADSDTSVNYGGGAQYFFDGRNGVRADYTRYDFTDGDLEADAWSVGYVRRF